MTNLDIRRRDSSMRPSSSGVVVVLGMHRSGTSLVAGLLARAGGWVGSEQALPPPQADNPAGFFERADVVDLNEELLASLGGSWTCPPSPEAVIARQDELRQRANDLWFDIAGDAPAGLPVVLKDPRLCVLWPVWRAALGEEIAVVLSVRNPLKVAQSLRQRDRLPLAVGLALWEMYTIGALNAAAGEHRVHVVPYASVLNNSSEAERLVSGIAEDVRLPVRKRDLSQALVGLAQPSLHRQRCEAENLDNYLTLAQQRLWRIVSELPAGPVTLSVPPTMRKVSEGSLAILRDVQARTVSESSVIGAIDRLSVAALNASSAELEAVQLQLEQARLALAQEEQRRLATWSTVETIRVEAAELARERDAAQTGLRQAEGAIRQAATREARQEMRLIESDVQLQEVRSQLAGSSGVIAGLMAEQAAWEVERDALRIRAASAHELAVMGERNSAELDRVRKNASADRSRAEELGAALMQARTELERLHEQVRDHIDARERLNVAFAQLRGDHLSVMGSESWRLGYALTSPVRHVRGLFSQTRSAENSVPGASQLAQEPRDPTKHRAAQVVSRDGAVLDVVIAPTVDFSRRKVALIAGHDQRRIVGPAVLHMGEGLRAAGWETLLIVSNQVDSEWLLHNGASVRAAFSGAYSREHDLRDFHSWALLLTSVVGLGRAKELLLLNDSVIGPLWSPSKLLKALGRSGRDVCGAVESGTPEPHLQSWFLWFGRKAIRDGAVLEYVDRDVTNLSKRELIERMEIPLASWFAERKYRVGAIVPALASAAGPHNPSTSRWDKILDAGVPFVKREIFTHPELMASFPREAVIERLRLASPYDVEALVDDSLAQQ